ncbi:MAG TPA: SH3 domain-containing protein [Anaerolineales bacterium]|nr:SH3 domain-containing protein [Anaerolineales bacterium]
MTEPERAALDHIRRVIDSVIGEAAATNVPAPAASGTGTGVNILQVPYISQLGSGASQFTNASGAASGAMLVGAYIGKAITPNDFFNQTGQQTDNPLSFTQISNVMTANGVPVEMRTGLKLSDLALILSSCRPAILLVKQTILQQAGLTPESFTGPHYLVAVGLDVNMAYVHDPLRKDSSGQGQGIPWLTLYQAWTQGQGYERAALVPRLQLVRRVRVTATKLNVRQQPNANASLAGTVNAGDVYEITAQKDGWGMIGPNRWVSLSYVADI